MAHRRDQPVTFFHASGIDIETLAEAFQATASLHPTSVALRSPDGNVRITWRSYQRRVERIATGLAALQHDWGEPIGLLLTNRIEFHLIDTAALHLGMTPFSIYNTLPAARIADICENAGNRVLVTERRFLRRVWDTGLRFAHVVCVDGAEAGTIGLHDLLRYPLRDFDFERRWRQVCPDDLATITYTSGTAGTPKGVELTHSNVLAQLAALADEIPTGFDDSVISYLPAAHIADRVTAHYANITRGVQVIPVPEPQQLATALPSVRPTVLFGVPRVWQKAKDGIETGIAAEPSWVRRHLAQWGLRVGARWADADIRNKRRGPLLRAQRHIADSLVLAPIRQRAGLDTVHFASSGAAPISADVLKFFHGLGIRVTEVWGLSEATGVVTSTTMREPTPGYVGKPLPGVEIALSREGEVLVRGSVVMQGYHRDPERTRHAFDAHGWLRTGDLANIDESGNLRIIGRKSEIIINDSGKNIAPSGIENAIRAESFLIGHIVVIGEGRPYLVALITLDVDAIQLDAQANGTTAADVAALSHRPSIREKITAAVGRANATVSRPEQVKRFLILDHSWEPGSDELTPKMSVRRTAIAHRYAEQIEALYAEAPGPDVIEAVPRRQHRSSRSRRARGARHS